ncbi:hypothetical protein EV138_6244 [Kribbella voronezhensis]|uniref:Uncharacterized protein n=1 Tax=Kribbella voronezhensis TaxID=2512212 RepID=A0A4R7SWP3_9ACTN|nr:hypothetical protein [Kribbella voronezhensis]TDU83780.1 hypothetical protein EV138_6244 [Kribbella voronezhensis]
MDALNGPPVHLTLVLIPLSALLLILAVFWVASRVRLAKVARSADVVHPAGDLFDPASADAAVSPPPAEPAAPPVRRHG